MENEATGEGWERPEGNGHEAEFSHDNKYVLAADEDFNQYRFQGRIDQGAAASSISAWPASPPRARSSRPSKGSSGDTRFVGEACVPATIAPATPA